MFPSLRPDMVECFSLEKLVILSTVLVPHTYLNALVLRPYTLVFQPYIGIRFSPLKTRCYWKLHSTQSCLTHGNMPHMGLLDIYIRMLLILSYLCFLELAWSTELLLQQWGTLHLACLSTHILEIALNPGNTMLPLSFIPHKPVPQRQGDGTMLMLAHIYARRPLWEDTCGVLNILLPQTSF